MKTKIPILLLELTMLTPLAARAQGTLTYDLLPDSTITPHNGAVATGPSQPLTGTFSWSLYLPSYVLDCNTFLVNSLDFQAPGYSLTLAAGSQPDSTTPSDPNGQTDMDANVNWAEGPPGSYFIGGFAEGTYTGPATAPTGLTMTEGFDAASGSGLWQDYVYIHATLVPEPSFTQLGLVALASLCAIRAWRALPAALKF